MENNIEKTPEELIKEFFDSNDLKNLDKESLGHWNSIMSSIVELRKNPSNHSMGLWLMLMMMVLPVNMLNNLPTEANEAD